MSMRVRGATDGEVWCMYACAAVSRDGDHEKNKTLIPIKMQHAETYGDNRSPILAAFQNSPNILVASVFVCVCVCVFVCVCARARVRVRYAPPQQHGT